MARTEWQVAPVDQQAAPGEVFRPIGASALMLRLVLAARPHDGMLEKIAVPLSEVLLSPQVGAVLPVAGQGWLAWNTEGLRPVFLQGLALYHTLTDVLPQIEAMLQGDGRVRWGLWVDRYVLSLGQNATPRVPPITAQAIFDFEPDNSFLCSKTLYEANRHWEHFVCVPRRLAVGRESQGYRFLDHKRPSALDHAWVTDASPFIGRTEELAFLTACYRRSRQSGMRAALFATAGSGKTRLVKHWRSQHPDLRALMAGFSLFGGNATSFAAQLADLPVQQLTSKALIASILERIQAERVNALTLDDLHWADLESTTFLECLLAALRGMPMFILLIARPSGRNLVESLQPTAVLDLQPLPVSAVRELAQSLAESSAVATVATQRAQGNPLFVEQFLAWAAETGYQGSGEAPHNLHQVIAARIDHLSSRRLPSLRQGLSLTSASERTQAAKALDRMQDEIGLWLDRLETGDYGDRVEVARYLSGLERIDFEIFLAKTMIGKPHARSSRLKESIDRLLVGSAEQILNDLKNRAAGAQEAERTNILGQTRRMGEVLAQHFQWGTACACYELALAMAQPDLHKDLANCLAQCRKHCLDTWNEAAMDANASAICVEACPAVDALRLPEVWIQLAYRDGRTEYFEQAAQAAEAINDRALAQWAQQKQAEATQFRH